MFEIMIINTSAGEKKNFTLVHLQEIGGSCLSA